MIAHLHLDDSLAREGVRQATIAVPGSPDRVLTFRCLNGPLPVEAGADPFLLATLLHFMSVGRDLHVHGVVSARLLRGIEELQGIWSLWRPDLYKRIAITTDGVAPGFPVDGPAISAFSGGVDALFTVQRHAIGLAGADRADLSAVLMVHGFDIHPDRHDIFESAERRATAQLAGTGLDILVVWTNLKFLLGQDWEHAFGLAVASCLTLFQPRYTVGLIGSGAPYDHWMTAPWGSSPSTDHFYSTGSMDIRLDGAFANRTEKVRSLSTWAEGIRGLRVCWEGPDQDRNCGHCEKCIRTYLNLLAAGAAPSCFGSPPNSRSIREVRVRNRIQLAELESISDFARQNGAPDSLLRPLDRVIWRNRHRSQWAESAAGRAFNLTRRSAIRVSKKAARITRAS